MKGRVVERVASSRLRRPAHQVRRLQLLPVRRRLGLRGAGDRHRSEHQRRPQVLGPRAAGGPRLARRRQTAQQHGAQPEAPTPRVNEQNKPEVAVSRSMRRITMALAMPAVAGLALSGCAGAGGGGGGGGGSDSAKSINVLMVGNPQMVDIQKLTADSFTKDTGIKVNYTVLPENELRDKVTQDVATGAGQYDVATVGAYEVPIWAKNGWLTADGLLRRRRQQLRQGRPAQADGRVRCPARTASSTAPVLRRVVVPDVPQGRPGEEEDHDAGAADLAAGRRHRGQGRRCRARHEGHLPARPPRLGRDVRTAHHGREHLRRHLVHQGLAGPGRRPGVQAGRQLLRRPGQEARRARRLAGRLHRVPQRDEPEQGRHVVRRHVGRRLAGGPERQQGRRQGRLRVRTGREDQVLRAGCGPGRG